MNKNRSKNTGKSFGLSWEHAQEEETRPKTVLQEKHQPHCHQENSRVKRAPVGLFKQVILHVTKGRKKAGSQRLKSLSEARFTFSRLPLLVPGYV